MSEDIVFRDRGALLNFVENNANILADHVDVTSSAGNVAYNIVFTEGFQTDGSTGLAGNTNISFNASTNKLALNASLETGPVGITGSLGVSGSTTLGDASGDTVTINAQTIDLANVAAGTDNTVLVYNGSSIVTDEIDSRVWGSTLVDGTNGTDNELAIFTDSDSIEGDSNLTWDGSTLDVGGALTVDGNTTLGDAYTDTVTIQAATTTLTPTGNNLPQLKLESKNGTVDNAGEIRFERYDDAVIAAGESLGEILFDATETDNGTYYSAATITGEVGTGTWTDASSHPGAIRFWTCADSGTTLTERMSIESDGTVAISADSNAYAEIGRARVGYGGGYSDYAYFSHVDSTAAGEYALLQYHDGKTFLNAATGEAIYFRINNVNGMTLDSSLDLNLDNNLDVAGTITVTTQPAFSAYGNADQALAAATWTTIEFNVEDYDVGGDFNTTTDTFTAPTTGKYMLSTQVRLSSVDSSSSQYVWIKIITSNRTYFHLNGVRYRDGGAYSTPALSVVADMDASDTAYVQVLVNVGTSTTQGSGGAQYTAFQGYLLG